MRRVAVGTVVAIAIAIPVVVVGVLVVRPGGADPSTRSRAADGRPVRGATARVRVDWSAPVRGWPSQISADRLGVVALSGGRFVSSFGSGDGSRRWETEVPGSLNPFMEPAVDAHSVLVSAGDRFVVLDRVDGVIRWEAPAGAVTGEAMGVALVPTAPGDAVAVTATFDGRLDGRDDATGMPRWSVAYDGILDAHLAFDPAAALVIAVWRTGAGATVRAIDAASGALRWEQAVEPGVASPTVAGDVVIVAAGDGDYRAEVRALGLLDGRVRWSSPVPGSFESDLVPGVALDASGHGEVGVEDHLGTVSLLDLRTGTLRWRTVTGVPALGGRLLITSEVVVVRNEGQQLVVLDRARGTVSGRRTDPDGLPEGITMAGDRVVVGWRWTQPGRIDALEIESARSRR